MIKKVRLPIILILIGIITLAITFIFISKLMIPETVVSQVANNSAIETSSTISNPVTNKSTSSTTNQVATGFKDGVIYLGTEQNQNIEVKDMNNQITEFELSDPNVIYQLKKSSNPTGVGVQYNKYYNNQLIGHYNLLENNGTWAGVYTNNNNQISNVSLK